MSRLRLKIKLLSPVCAGTGLGTPGFVDREASFTEHGLPFLGARRLRGLWRDAYDDLSSSALGTRLPPAGRIFGSEFGTKSEAGKLRLSNAALSGGNQAVAWMDTMQISALEVQACFSEIRRQTAINHTLGRAQTETLRSTRVVHPKLPGSKEPLIFHAVVGGGFEVAEIMALAAAARALRAIGSSRNRGWGEVDCTLEDESGRDFTNDALAWLTIGERPENGYSRGESLANRVPGELSTSGTLRFQLTLNADAVVPRMGGDPFTIHTHDHIPGSTIRGILAHEYLDLNAGTPDPEFYRLFCSQDVHFLPAYPAVIAAGRSGDAKPAHPVPCSLRQYKDEAAGVRFVDLAWEKPEPNRAYSRVSKHAVLDDYWQLGRTQMVATRKHIHYHHTRSSNRLVQRALGQEFDPDIYGGNTNPGAFFTYEAIAVNQVFEGQIRGPQGALTEVRKLIASHAEVAVGRSRAAEYGGSAEWQWVDDSLPERDPGTECDYSRITVTLLTPLLGWNRHGHPAPALPLEELAEALQVEIDGIVPTKEYVRRSWESGYLEHQKLPRAQMPSLAAGSVFVLHLQEPVSPGKLREAEGRGYGMRCEDGFGQLSLRPTPLEPEPENGPLMKGFQEVKCSCEPKREHEQESCDLTRMLETAVLQRRLRETAVAEGFKLAGTTRLPEPLEAHSLARISRVLDQQPSLEEFAALFRQKTEKDRNVLRGPIRRKLGRIRLSLDQSGLGERRQVSLDEFLALAAGRWKDIFRRIEEVSLSHEMRSKAVTSVEESFKAEIAKTFFLSFLRALAVRVREANRKKKESQEQP